MSRTLALLLVFLAAGLSACIGLDGNGHRVRESRPHRDFTRIEAHGPFDVRVRAADELSVVVSIDSNLVNDVDTFVRSDTLIIDSEARLYDFVPGPHVLIDMPRLTFARLDGSGSLDAQTFDEAGTVRLELDGSGDLWFTGSAPRIEAGLSGSGVLGLTGSTDFAELDLAGSGDLLARELDAAEGSVRVSGSGDVSATLNGPAEAEVEGSGDIDLYGNVDLDHSRVSGSGEVRVH